MNIDVNVVESPLNGSQPMPSHEGQQSQVNDDPTDNFWDQIVVEIDESQLQSTLLVVLNISSTTEASVPLNTPSSS